MYPEIIEAAQNKLENETLNPTEKLQENQLCNSVEWKIV